MGRFWPSSPTVQRTEGARPHASARASGFAKKPSGFSLTGIGFLHCYPGSLTAYGKVPPLSFLPHE
jgi:hypothetical protein